MSHNPYLPPAATVEDVNKAAIGRRPVTVGIAVLLLTLGVLYSASVTRRVARRSSSWSPAAP